MSNDEKMNIANADGRTSLNKGNELIRSCFDLIDLFLTLRKFDKYITIFYLV